MPFALAEWAPCYDLRATRRIAAQTEWPVLQLNWPKPNSAQCDHKTLYCKSDQSVAAIESLETVGMSVGKSGQETGASMVSPRRRPPSLVVGIGASAGGLAAFKTFFDNMPADTGMAFVLVQHLDPDHKSLLVELLRPHSAMPVVEAQDHDPLAPNQVYVIPPNATLSLEETFYALRRPRPRGSIVVRSTRSSRRSRRARRIAQSASSCPVSAATGRSASRPSRSMAGLRWLRRSSTIPQ